ncbi:hypothetical protein [Streptomyces sp. NPDC047070]|uniref:hypothetical protein n=1 Tax=Streptomyces sp. NPDC047070 TaxID=3154923 RepID=UPI003452B90B
MRDTRLVQTAVIGDEHSDVPVVLPTEAIELDAFRRVHGHDTFWCGLLLGGCGTQLTHKLYVDRQCHFQHRAQLGGTPHDCRRPKVGPSSADHLYVKAAMSHSLLDHGRTGRFAYPTPVGSLLDVDLDDGVALRVHMDGSVAPDWAGGRTPVLGPGVMPEPGVLSRCPYVYRVRCESDGADRRAWIGTQSLALPTEWVPLADCSWSENGLITPAATDILRQQAAPTSPAPARAEQELHRPGALPEHVVRFIRGLEAAQRAGTVEHVRRLCEGSFDFLDRLDLAVLEEAEEALDEARSWLAVHEDYQQRVFADLEAAVRERRAWDVRSQLQTASALTRRGASAEEQRVLAVARAFVRRQDHLPDTPPQSLLQPLPAPRFRRAPARTTVAAWLDPIRREPPPSAPQRKKERERSQQAAAPNASRRERQERRAALRRARFILDHLDTQRLHLSADEQRELARELETVADVAGDWLSADEQRDARYWIRKTSRPSKKDRPNPARRELAPDVRRLAACRPHPPPRSSAARSPDSAFPAAAAVTRATGSAPAVYGCRSCASRTADWVTPSAAGGHMQDDGAVVRELLGDAWWSAVLKQSDDLTRAAQARVPQAITRLNALLQAWAVGFAAVRADVLSPFIAASRRGLGADESAGFLTALDTRLLHVDSAGFVRPQAFRQKKPGGRYALFSRNGSGVSLNLEYLIQLTAAAEFISLHKTAGHDVCFEQGEFDAVVETDGVPVTVMEAKARIQGPDSLTGLLASLLAMCENPGTPASRNHQRKYAALRKITAGAPVTLMLVAEGARWTFDAATAHGRLILTPRPQ